ncbi:hypothetical protein [Synechococcus sp. PCC 6312]|uniref:hypothetical protein n=1 Tax=Synechococcus sp. (strain ATCC 27167 / PCC 6312) TaxID=195253 RepID=UPI00029EF82F|nr:hypothetical protein [Synechococcus sp. PCC 6312]AFY60914.1 hypothetical protein Syn6312_1766 [Synechococcus sp. PCC 6312]
MKAVKAMATINHQGQLTLDHPLTIDENSRVEVIILVPESDATDEPTQVEVLADFA